MWSGLAVAVGFAILLNVLIVSTLVWTEWIGANVRFGLWVGLIGTWLISAVADRYRARTRQSPHRDGLRAGHGARAESEGELTEKMNGDLFRNSQAQYLQGNWYEAEMLLVTLLKGSPRDVEARLLLATLYRHRERFEEAGRSLAELERSEEAEGWSREIHNERAGLARVRTNESPIEQSPSSDGGSDMACDQAA